jgi:cytochrome b6-f complex iron-sulfur subunit
VTEQEHPEDAPAEETTAEEPKAEAPARAAAKSTPAQRGERAAAEPAGPGYAVVQAENLPGTPIVSRRRVLQAGFWLAMGGIATGVAACGIEMIYPSTVTGFGGTVNVGAERIPAPGDKAQIPEGRFWLVNLTAEQGGPGLLALWWKCPHLGCTVPWRPNFSWPDPVTGAQKLGWFRCPCHGSTYTDAGVRVFGPAPRSMDTMAITVNGDSISVDTGAITNGAPDNSSRAVRI